MKPVEIEILMKGNLGRGLDDARRKAESLDSVLKRVGATVGIAFGTREAIDFARRIMEVRGEVESLQISFETLAGKTKGQKLFGDIREFAVNTPMMMQDLAKGAQTLLGFNIEAEKVMPILRQIGDISMGDAQKFNSLTLAFAQMSSTGKLMGQDLLQMINAGFNPLVVISEKTGKSMAALKKEMSEGRISVKMVEDAFASATAEGGRFHGMLEKQSKGIKGAMSNLQGAWEDMLNDIGEKSQGRMVEAINIVQQLVKNYEKVLDVLAQIVVAYGAYKGALMAIEAIHKAQTVARMIKLYLAYRDALGSARAAQLAFNRAALVNPYVLIGAAAAGAAVSIYKMATADNAAEAAQKKLNKTLEDADKLAKDNQRELEELTRTATDEAASTDDRRTAMQQLIDKYPNIIKKYIDEKGHLTDIINLKREIARLDGQEKAGKLEEETNKAKRYLELYDKSRKGIQLSAGDRKIMNQLADEIWDQQSFWTKTISGSRGKFAADYYRNQLPGLERSSARTKTENMLRDYNYNLEKMTDEQLKRMADTAQRSLSKIGGGNSSIEDIYTHDFLTRSDYAERLATIGTILEQRHPVKDTTTTTKTGKKDTLKEQREQAAKAIEEERRWQEEVARIKRDAADAQRDAEIAAIENDGERERAEQDEQHKRRLRQIQDQADEMKKAVYEHNKTVWEDAHKDSPYVLTEEGRKDWRDVQLPSDQQAAINAKISQENANEQRRLLEIQKQEIQSMRDYLKEYGTIQEQKYAIAKEYDEKIAEARDEWQRKSLEAEKQKAIDAIDIEVLRTEIDWSLIFDGFSDAFQDEVNAAIGKIDKFMQSDKFKSLGADEKRQYVNLHNELSQKAGSKVGTFDFSIYKQIGRELTEYQNAVRKAKEANQQHSFAILELEAAEKELKAADEDLKKKIEKGDLGQGYVQAQLRVKAATAQKNAADENAKKTGEKSRKAETDAIVAQGKLKESVTQSRMALDNFSNAMDQITSGTLRGFADGIINMVNAIKGNGLTNGLLGLGSLGGKVSKTADAAGKAIDAAGKAASGVNEGAEALQKAASEAGSASGNIYGMIVAAILDLLDALGDDAGGAIGGILDKVFDVIAGIIEQLGSGQLLGQLVNSIVNGLGKIFESIGNLVTGIFSGSFFEGLFGGFGDTKKYEKEQERLTRAIDSTTAALDHFTEELEKSYGVVAMQNAEKAESLIRDNMKAIVNGIDSVLSDNYGGGHSDYYHLNKNFFFNREIEQYANKFGMTMYDPESSYGLTWHQLLENDPEKLAQMFKDIRQNDSDLWRRITTEAGYNEGKLEEWINKLINAYDQMDENLKQELEQLTTTTEDNVFEGFLDNLYDLADGSTEVFDDIADNWQEMVNRMAVNNIVGESFRGDLKKWYDRLAKANQKLSKDRETDAEAAEEEYKEALAELKTDYLDMMNSAKESVEQLREIGVVKNTESGSGQTAKVGGFNAMSQDQGTKLDGMFTAGLQHWSSMDKELGNVTDRLGNALDHLRKIEENTEHCKKLDDIAEDIRSIKNSGIKMK